MGVLPEDYYAFVENEEPLYKYDKETDEYIYNEESPGTDAITDLDSGYIYNYILDKKESKEDLIILTYYGLYAYQDEIGPTTITNQKNIERLLNYEETFEISINYWSRSCSSYLTVRIWNTELTE